jgi:hypothetical protein
MKETLFAFLVLSWPLAARAQGSFTYAAHDNVVNVGHFSMVLGADGRGLIVYGVSMSSNPLKVARCVDVACSSVTNVTLEDSAAAWSMTIGGDGLPLITYTVGGALKVAHCSTPDCSIASLTTLDGTDTFSPVITTGADGLGLVAYGHSTPPTGELRVARCSDAACSSATIATVATGVNLTESLDIAVGGDGLGLITYRDFVSGLQIVHCLDAACTSATTFPLDPVGHLASLAIGADGLGIVAFMAFNPGSEVMMAHCSDAPCSTATITRLDRGQSPRVVIGSDGLPLVSYDKVPVAATGDIRVAHCTDAACTEATVAAHDVLGVWGSEPRIRVGPDGRALIAYFDTTDARLRTLHCGNARCQARRSDFNADSRPDLVWRHGNSGANVVWFMNGVTLASGTFTNPGLPDPDWTIVGTNDFNGDARADLLWRHQTQGTNGVWFMNGVDLQPGPFPNLPLVTNVDWKVVGTGLFGDAHDALPDLLWHHSASGETVVWFLNGASFLGGTFTTPSGVADPSWSVAGVGDFDEDGQADILWHHGTAGQLVVWYMNGATMTAGTFTDPPTLADVAWKPAAVEDYNDDFRPDIVWRHQTSGQVAVWFMNGATLVGGSLTSPPGVADLNWKLVGPR